MHAPVLLQVISSSTCGVDKACARSLSSIRCSVLSGCSRTATMTTITTTTTTNPPPLQPGQRICAPQTFLKFRFRVLFWRHSQTQLIGSLSDQMRSLAVAMSSGQRALRHRSQSGGGTEYGLPLHHVTRVATAEMRSGAPPRLRKNALRRDTWPRCC